MVSTLHHYGEYDSWTVVNDSIAIKRTDMTFIKKNETGIPAKIRWFFDAEIFPKGLRNIYISLVFEDKQYRARVNLHKTGIVRLFWYADLKKELLVHYHSDDYPLARFEKIENRVYRIEFLDKIENDNDGSDPLESVFVPQVEGQKKEYYVTRYERNKENRRQAILIHGTQCMACGFDFGAFYGEAGKGFIEVHHIKPLHEKDEEAMVNPSTDLVCLCSNCHRMIHRKKNGVYTVDELKKLIITN